MDRNFESDLIIRAEQSCDCLEDMEPGTKERLTEAQVYDTHVKNLIELKRLELEAKKDAREQKMKEEEAKWTKKMDLTKLGLTVAQIGLSAASFVVMLKANMNIGNMSGRDAKSYIDEIKRWKF